MITLSSYPSAHTPNWFCTLPWVQKGFKCWDAGVQNMQTIFPRRPCQLADWDVLPIRSTQWYWKWGQVERELPASTPNLVPLAAVAVTLGQVCSFFLPSTSQPHCGPYLPCFFFIPGSCCSGFLGHQGSLFALSALQWLCNDIPTQIYSILND